MSAAAKRFANAGGQLMDASLLKKVSNQLVEVTAALRKRADDVVGIGGKSGAEKLRIQAEEIATIGKKNVARMDGDDMAEAVAEAMGEITDPQAVKRLENAKKLNSKFGEAEEVVSSGLGSTKKIDDLPGGDTAKRFAKADEATGATTFCAGNKTICYAPFVFGGLYYLDEKKKGMEENKKACMSICLPNNMDTLASSDWGGTDTAVEYTTVADIQELHENFTQADITTGKTPVCQQGTGPECLTYCDAKCDKDYDGLGAGLIGLGVDATKAGIDFAIDTGAGALGGLGDALGLGNLKWYIIGFVVLMLLGVVMKAMSGGRR